MTGGGRCIGLVISEVTLGKYLVFATNVLIGLGIILVLSLAYFALIVTERSR